MVEGNEAPVLSALDKKIVKQIEYYFGDMNLPRDNFLREEIKKENGWVCLETMVKFNRLKQLTSDYNIITTALKASGTTFIQVSEDNEKIRRNPDLPVPEFNKERNEDLKARSLYAKGFPLDITLDRLIEFFEKFGKVDQIQMRKDAKKSFKGSVFVVFNSKEEGQKFLNAESVKHGETELKRETREGYFKRKEEERKSKKEEQIQKKIQMKKRQEEEDTKKLNDRMTKGAILCLKNIATGTTREQIKEAFDMYSPIAYIEFNMGDTEAALRFETEGSASVALDKAKDANEGKISINGGDVEYTVLEGDAEVEHWKKIFQDQKERRDFKRKGNFGGRGRKRFGGGGRYDSQKRQQNNEKDKDNNDNNDNKDNKQAANEGEPAAKKQKTEIEATS